MKNKTLRGLLRLAAFGLCFVPVLLFANTFLIKTDTYARLTLAEMKQRSDIDMVFVGSSIVRDHFNAEMITKETEMCIRDRYWGYISRKQALIFIVSYSNKTVSFPVSDS